MMPWLKPRRSGIGGLASQGAKPVDRCVLAKGTNTRPTTRSWRASCGSMPFRPGLDNLNRNITQLKSSAWPGCVPRSRGHGTAIGQPRDYSRNARLIWSVNGFIRNEMTVRSVVRMNASTGMPGLRLSGSNEPSLPSSSLIRTL